MTWEHRPLGDYKIIKQLGVGSLGNVFLAEHRFMKKQYALKVLPEELSQNRQFIQNFEETISFLSSLQHPNLLKVHNVSYADGRYFLVTDCIVDDLGETTNLARFLASSEGPLKESWLLHFIKQVAAGLDELHEQKLFGQPFAHHHLKPNNILLGKGLGGDVHVFLSDSGLAQLIGISQVISKTTQVLAHAFGLGRLDQYTMSPPVLSEVDMREDISKKMMQYQLSFLQNYAFLSPEQKKIATKEIGPASDVYSFGVLVYYLLTKQFPEGIFELPPSNAVYPARWGDLIHACLQLNPSKRPSHLKEAIEDILIPKEMVVLSSLEHVVKEKIEPLNNVRQPVSHLPKEDVIVLHSQVVEHDVEHRLILKESTLKRPSYEEDPAKLFEVESGVTVYHQKTVERREIDPLLTDMVIVKGGKFRRGSENGNRDEMPPHAVFLNTFALDIHPVTNEQFIRFLEVMGGEKDANNNDIIRLRESRLRRSAGRLTIESGYSKHPVVGVTWYGALAYANWIGKRLPTEAEWEIASRGGLEDGSYPTGENIEKNQSNFFSSDTTAVMSYAPNIFGLYDMPGNVYEWCQDWYGYNYYEESILEPNQPKGPLQGVYRVLRGGCWKSLKEDLRCSHRHRNNPGTVNRTYGFRCAADVV